jgi:membrane carboxypeptidase/penicillin-binding protein PbpC
MVGCDGGAAQAGPRIVSPQAGQSALLVPGVDAHKQEIPLEADGGAAEGSLSWFVDGAFLGATKSEQRLWWTPRAGTHEIVVMDADGRSARRTFDVRALP